MKFRNRTKLFFTGVLALAVLSACTPAEKHTHAATEWDRDITSHWQACVCGEKMGDAAAHTTEGKQCTECGTMIDQFAGKICLYNFNELERSSTMTDTPTNTTKTTTTSAWKPPTTADSPIFTSTP